MKKYSYVVENNEYVFKVSYNTVYHFSNWIMYGQCRYGLTISRVSSAVIAG